MNKVITINLGGTAFQLEDAGYEALNRYLESARARLQNNPDREEILSDIEQAFGEKFRGLLNSHKNVVLATEIDAVLQQMGPVEDDSTATSDAAAGTGASADAESGAAAAPSGQPRKLYRVLEGRQLTGVCNGLGLHFGIDPTIVRIIFAALTIFWGVGLLLYVVMIFVIPIARTPEQKAEATGSPSTAQEFIRRAKEGYYDAMKSFPDRHARREWKRRFRQEMRDWRTGCRREVDANSQRWQAAWAAHPGAGLMLPIVSFLNGAVKIAFFCALISLLATGALFGLGLPAGLPVWGAVLILCVVSGMITWPLKAARRAFYFGMCGSPSGVWPFFFVLDVIVWIAVVAVVLWLAYHHFPQIHEAIQNLPGVVHDAVNSIRDWWHR